DVLSGGGGGGVSECDSVEVVLAGSVGELVVVLLFGVGELLFGVGELLFGVGELLFGVDVWGIRAGMKGLVSYEVVGDCCLDVGLMVCVRQPMILKWLKLGGLSWRSSNGDL
ncbi:hypothetical protein Tco_1089608, partial [Tanacetum coccineum]